VFVIKGEVTINDISLEQRDGLGVFETEKLHIIANSDTEFLLIEVPMQF
jgi:redox-sensitive bicupin YhaK (pirin superfamily)